MMANAGNVPQLTQTIVVSCTLCALKITYNTWPSNNFEFLFQLVTVGLLSTSGFQNFKYEEQGIF